MPHTLIPNIHDFIATIDPFDKLPKELQRKIACCIKINYLAKGDQIHFGEQDEERYLYIIRTGSMEQRKHNGMLRAKLGVEDLFGFTFLNAQSEPQETYSAVAIESTLLYLVPHGELLKLLEDYPDFSEHFASNAQVRLHSALDVAWADNEKRIFVKKVADVASDKIAVVDATTPVRDVAEEIMNVCSPTAVIKEKGEIVGLITDRDMTKRVIVAGIDFNTPVKEIMTPNPLTVEPEDLVIKASTIMMQNNVRSLPVVKDNDVLGVITTTHLVRNNKVQAIFLIEKIKYAKTVKDLTVLTPERQAIFEAFIEGKVAADVIAHVMTMIMDAYNRRLIQMAEEYFGEAPCDYAWIVAGSHARNEVHMLSDQHNAIILDDTASAEDRAYFQELAKWVCDGLDACGYPYCNSKFMAANPKWCIPLKVWMASYKKWISNPEYDSLLNVTVFLETRYLYGKEALNKKLQQHLFTTIKQSSVFLSSLVKQSVSVSPPLGIFNSLVLQKSGEDSKTFDIKKYAINLIVDMARIYGLASGSEQTDTIERFTHANQKELLGYDMLKNVESAYRFIAQVRLTHQLAELKEGKRPDNHIDPNSFGSFERNYLKDAFRIIADLQEAAHFRFNRS